MSNRAVSALLRFLTVFFGPHKGGVSSPPVQSGPVAPPPPPPPPVSPPTPPRPVAVNDTLSVNADIGTAQTGNVLTNDTGGTPPVRVNSVLGETDNVGVSTATTYGHVTINADGSRSYTLDTSIPGVAGLLSGSTLTDTIGYALRDAIGRVSTASLVVAIHGVVAVEDGDIGGPVDDPTLTPMVFAQPGFTTFMNIGGWDQTIAMFTANKALMTHVTLDNPDWIEGPGTRLTVLDAVHAAGLKAATGAGRRFSGSSWSDPSVAAVNEKSYLPAQVINHAALQGGGLLQLPDESDLYWDGGNGDATASPTAVLQITADWKAGNGGTLSGVKVYHNTLSRPQMYGNYAVNAGYLNDPNLFGTSADQYPITVAPNQQILVGLSSGSGPFGEFTTGSTGKVTWINKFGPHPSGATGQLGKPHFEALSMCRQTDEGRDLTAAEQDLLAWSIVIMGGDGWTQFTTSFLTGAAPGTNRDNWSPSSAGLPGGMKVWMAKAIARVALIHSKGCLFRDAAHGGGRSWFRIRRSAPAIGPLAGVGEPNYQSDEGPKNGVAPTWAAPASLNFLPGGWQAIRMWNEAQSQSWFLLQNIDTVTASRTLTLAGDDPWHAALSGKTHGPGEVVFYNSDGTVVSGWPT